MSKAFENVVKLRDIVNVRDFGAVGDGVANDTAALQAALNTGKSVYIPSGSFFFNQPIKYKANNQAIFGSGNDSILKHRGPTSTSWIETDGFDNVSFSTLQLDGGEYVAPATGLNANPGFWITNGSVNVTVENVLFNGGNQVVYLSACSDVKVVNCTFDGCGYGIIQRQGFVSSNVLIDGNTCRNAVLDFVEANCFTAPSENWVITNNTYSGNKYYPNPPAGPFTEGRFVGITSVRGVVISGNTVFKSAGDAPIHLEDVRGETIVANNVLDNCLTSGGNLGYVFLLNIPNTSNSDENTIISGNIFLRTDTTLPYAYAIDTSSNSYDISVIVADNMVLGNGSSGNLGGFRLAFQNAFSSTTCTGNILRDLDEGVICDNLQNAVIANNVFQNCSEPITATLQLTNSLINNNLFLATVGANDILLGAATRVDVQNNKFSKNVILGTETDVFCANNSFGTGASLVGFSGTRSYAVGNAFQNIGQFVSQYPNLGTTQTVSASKSAQLVSGSAVVSFRVTCAATVDDWYPGSIRIEASACDGNGSEFASAWWQYRFKVLGSDDETSEAVEDSGGTVGSYVIAFTPVSETATQVVFDVTVTATNADRCVASLSCVYWSRIISVV